MGTPHRLWLWRIDGDEFGSSAGAQTVYAVTTTGDPPDPNQAIEIASDGGYEFSEVRSITFVCQVPSCLRVGADQPPADWADAVGGIIRRATESTIVVPEYDL